MPDKTVHIVAPKNKAIGCGVTDHTTIIVKALQAKGVCVYVHNFTGSPISLSAAKKGDLVFVQLSIYGYSRRGAPTWLINSLKSAKKNGVRIVTFFHELWVSWPKITSSDFWLAPLQLYICQRILALSDSAAFNVEWGFQWAQRRSANKVLYIRTFSTIGESNTVSPWIARRNCLAVFGNPGARVDVYRALIAHISNQERTKRLHHLELLDIGRPSEEVDKFLKIDGQLSDSFGRCTQAGPLAAQDLQQALDQCKFGLFATPWNHAGKSSILAAYMAHGLCPISIHPENHARAPQLLAPKADVHFALLHNLDLNSIHNSAIYESMAGLAHQTYDRSDRIVELIRDEIDAA